MLYVRFPLSLRNVEDLLHERGIEISHETVRFWWNRFGPMFANVRCSPLFSPQPFQPGTPLLLTRQFQVQSNRHSVRQAARFSYIAIFFVIYGRYKYNLPT